MKYIFLLLIPLLNAFGEDRYKINELKFKDGKTDIFNFAETSIDFTCVDITKNDIWMVIIRSDKNPLMTLSVNKADLEFQLLTVTTSKQFEFNSKEKLISIMELSAGKLVCIDLSDKISGPILYVKNDETPVFIPDKR